MPNKICQICQQHYILGLKPGPKRRKPYCDVCYLLFSKSIVTLKKAYVYPLIQSFGIKRFSALMDESPNFVLNYIQSPRIAFRNQRHDDKTGHVFMKTRLVYAIQLLSKQSAQQTAAAFVRMGVRRICELCGGHEARPSSYGLVCQKCLKQYQKRLANI